MLSSFLLLVVWFFTSTSLAVYAPESGDDWTLLKPDSDSPFHSFNTVPFEFGIIVTPYVVTDEGKLARPPLSSFTRSHTTTVTTSIIMVTQAPTPTKEVEVYQIQDGQVQKYPNYPGNGNSAWEEEEDENCDKDDKEIVEEDCDDEYRYSYNKRDWDDCGNDEDHGWDEIEYPVFGVACKKKSTLVMRLDNSVLWDSENRIGSIVSGHQFQFDGPVPQHGTIYAAGWSITKDGQLALGDSTKFYQCASGEFYNLYDRAIGGQCFPVVLDIVELKDC